MDLRGRIPKPRGDELALHIHAVPSSPPNIAYGHADVQPLAFAPVLDDPLGDGKQGFLDFRSGYAFINQHALYMLVNVEDVKAPFVLFDMHFSNDEGFYQITWFPGQAGLSLGFYGNNGSFVDLGFIERSSFAFQEALEARIDLRDIGSDLALNGINVMAMAGEGESWGPADTWTTTYPLSIEEEVDPPEIVYFLPPLCDKKKIPYLFIDDKKDIGLAIGLMKIGTAAAAILDEGKLKDRVDNLVEKVKKLK